jgi:hypothetical protein
MPTSVTIMTSLMIENVAFSSGTNGAARTPVSALSWSTKIAPVMIDTTNQAARNGPDRRKSSWGSTWGMRSRNPTPIAAATAVLAA